MTVQKRPADFSGWATKYNVLCSDGLVLRPGTFAHEDGNQIPLVYQHDHSGLTNVLGHAIVHERPEGVRVDAYLDTTPEGENAKAKVKSGTINALSIYADQVQKDGNAVRHARLLEVSLVLRGANPQAQIDEVFAHSNSEYPEAYISIEGAIDPLEHSEDSAKKEDRPRTVQEVFEGMDDEEKNAVYSIAAAAVEAATTPDDTDTDDTDNKKEEPDVAHNVFDNTSTETISHAEKLEEARSVILSDIPSTGSFKGAFVKHAKDYGIKDPSVLFPDAKNAAVTYTRPQDAWVQRILGGTHHLPYSRFTNRYYVETINGQSRAYGYQTGTKKKDSSYELKKRTTIPTTVYAKTKLDRDDELDITDMDVVAWLDGQLRYDLERDIARSILLGDGRATTDPDKVDPERVRPILKDDDVFSIKWFLGTDVLKAEKTDGTFSLKDLTLVKWDKVVENIVKAQADLDATGTPDFFATKQFIHAMLWARDENGRRFYNSRAELADALEVNGIYEVPQLTTTTLDKTGHGDAGIDFPISPLAILVNPADYWVGSDKGGEITSFSDFDIDYNQRKALKETRISGALSKPNSALVILPNTTKVTNGPGVGSLKTKNPAEVKHIPLT